MGKIDLEQTTKYASLGILPILLLMTFSNTVNAISDNLSNKRIDDFINSRTPDDFDKDGFSNEYEISLGFDHLNDSSYPQLPEAFFSTLSNYQGYSEYAVNRDIPGLLLHLHSQESFQTNSISEFYADEDRDGLVVGLESLYSIENYFRIESTESTKANSIYDIDSDGDDDGLLDSDEIVLFGTNPFIKDQNSSEIFFKNFGSEPELSVLARYLDTTDARERFNSLNVNYEVNREKLFASVIAKLMELDISSVTFDYSGNFDRNIVIHCGDNQLNLIDDETFIMKRYGEINDENIDSSVMGFYNFTTDELFLNTKQSEDFDGVSDSEILRNMVHELIHKESRKYNEDEILSQMDNKISNKFFEEKNDGYKVIETNGAIIKLVYGPNGEYEYGHYSGFNEALTVLISEYELLGMGIESDVSDVSYPADIMRRILDEVGIETSELRQVMKGETLGFPYLFNKLKEYFDSNPTISILMDSSEDKVWRLFFYFQDHLNKEIDDEQMLDKIISAGLFD